MSVCLCAYEWETRSEQAMFIHINSTVNVRIRQRETATAKRNLFEKSSVARETERKQRNKYIEYRTICAHNSFISSGFFPFNLVFCFLGPISWIRTLREWLVPASILCAVVFFLSLLSLCFIINSKLCYFCCSASMQTCTDTRTHIQFPTYQTASTTTAACTHINF